MKNNPWITLITLIFIFGFLIGLIQLFLLRFESGDIYPPYSTLRTDPLGVKALYESLERSNHLSVQRNYDPSVKIESPQDTVLFYLGLDISDYQNLTFFNKNHLENFVAHGGRLVLSFFPKNSQTKNKNPKETSHPEDLPTHSSGRQTNFSSFWASGLTLKDERFTEEDVAVLKKTDHHAFKDDVELSLHSSLYFDLLTPDWHVVYARKNLPVIVERKVGEGSIVLSALSYFFSNEALFKERRPELLSWLIAEKNAVIFDEFHLGLAKETGIADLGRKYDLHRLFYGLVILAILFVWKNAIPLIPPYSDDVLIKKSIQGKDYIAGLINLLRRNIPEKQILKVCVEEWKKSLHSHKTDRRASKDLEAIVENAIQKIENRQNPIEAYNTLVQTLKERDSNYR